MPSLEGDLLFGDHTADHLRYRGVLWWRGLVCTEKCNSCRYAEEKTGWVPCDNPPMDVLFSGSVEDCSMYEEKDNGMQERKEEG